jgi:hypothetical protein
LGLAARAISWDGISASVAIFREEAEKQSETLLLQILPRDTAEAHGGREGHSFSIESAATMFIDIVKSSEHASVLARREICLPDVPPQPTRSRWSGSPWMHSRSPDINMRTSAFRENRDKHRRASLQHHRRPGQRRRSSEGTRGVVAEINFPIEYMSEIEFKGKARTRL